MRKINPSTGYDDMDQAQDEVVIKALSHDEAQALREKNPLLSPWVVLAVQAAMGLLVAAVVWLLTGRAAAGWSALYGAAAVVIPGALFARGLMSKVSLSKPGAAVAGFFMWEMVKIALTVAMLVAAPKLVENLSWLAMLAGFVVTMKAYWLALWLRRSRPIGKSN